MHRYSLLDTNRARLSPDPGWYLRYLPKSSPPGRQEVVLLIPEAIRSQITVTACVL